MLHLRSISIRDTVPDAESGHPFSVPLVAARATIELTAPVTILVGENGAGKSTLLEGLAAATELPVVGGQSIARDPSLQAARALAPYLALSWSKRTRSGFFLRAEDFFNFARKTREDQLELQGLADEFGRTLSGYGRKLAVGAALGQKEQMRRRYGDDLDANSHGESFLRLFQSRLQPNGVYILDEPETPLSPLRQIALIAMIQDAVREGSQFLIATHAPILMAIPGAQLLSLENGAFRTAAFEELEHVSITRRFLENPESFLRHL